MKMLVSVAAASVLAAGATAAQAVQISAAPIVSALPDVKSMSQANAAGVLQYCLENQLVSHSAADPVLAPLTGQREVTASPDYSAGKAGRILTGGKSFSLAQASGHLKSQACDKVFRQAKRFK